MKKYLALALIIFSSSFSLSASKIIKFQSPEAKYTAADFDYVEYIKNQDISVKLFSVSGGYPAMNGNYINLAIFNDPETGWKAFELDNVREYKILPSAKKDYLKIKIIKDIMDNEGNIIQRTSMLYINITSSDSGSIQTEEVLK